MSEDLGRLDRILKQQQELQGQSFFASDKRGSSQVKESPKEEDKKSVKKRSNLRNYFIFGLLFLIIFLIVIFPFSNVKKKVPTCGDGSFYDTCSLTKPYFCEDGVLYELSSRCGCPDGMNKSEEFCIGEGYDNPSDSHLSYVLDGERGDLDLRIYPDVLDYLESLPKFKVYYNNEEPRRDDFKIMKINNEIQRQVLMPLVVQIQNLAPNSKDEQAKIAISLVQHIVYGEPDFSNFKGMQVRLPKYPYQTLANYKGSCEGKSEVLAFLLKELDFGVSLFYFKEENHEAVGIKCPIEESYYNTGYCFVETTVPSPVTFSSGRYLGVGGSGRLESEPKVIVLNGGISLSESLEDYADASYLDKVLNGNSFSFEKVFNKRTYDSVKKKYGMN